MNITRAGLGDYTCPPSGLAVYYNAITAPKRILWVQGSEHGLVPERPRQESERKSETWDPPKPVAGEFAFTVNPEPARGGVADVSSFLDAPAGKHGFVRVDKGHLATDAGRLYLNGVNLTGSANFPAKAQAERLARQLAARGVNCVRLHYMDSDYGNFMQRPEPGLVVTNADYSFSLRAAELDRLDYLVAQLKAHGIYVDLNLHVARFLKNKAPLWFGRELIATQKEYAQKLLTHVNPYTRLPWKDEPAVAFVELTNEGGIMDSGIMKGKYGQEFVKSVLDTERDYLKEMMKYLKEEVGVKCPVTGTHLTFSPAHAQATADLVIYNSYWNHPEVGADWIQRDEAIVNWAGTDWNNLAFDFTRKVKGKPFVITEYGHPWPNHFGGEGQPLVRAYGAFQDIDGVFTYSWQNRSDIEPDYVEYFFSNGSRPDVVCHLPAMAAMFLRRDVKPAKETIVVPADEKAYCRRFVEKRYVPEDTQTASRAKVRYEWAQIHGTEIDLSGAAPMPEDHGRIGKIAVSDTGELVWDRSVEKAGYVICKAENVKLFTGFVKNRIFDLGGGVELAVGRTAKDWATVSILSRDGNGFKSGSRVLLAATAGVRNTGAKLTVDDHYQDGMAKIATRGEDWGRGPVLCEPVPFSVTFGKAKSLRVWALDGSGARREELTASGNRFTATGDEKTVWYEIELSGSADVGK